jgi:hypothetical protein
MNPNDEIRAQILQYFYDRNSKATSRYGKKGSAVKISDVKKELKSEYGLAQQQVMSNLTYLIDQGWVKELQTERSVTTKGGMTVPRVVTWYEVSAEGIDKLEGHSEFEPTERYAGINIHAAGTNVITLGDGNVVNASFSDLHAALDDLKSALAQSDAIPDTDKLDAAVDIESIKDQLAKANPNPTVVSTLWGGLEAAGRVAGLIELIDKLRPLIGPLMSK